MRAVQGWKCEDETKLILTAEKSVIAVRITEDGILRLQANGGEEIFEEESFVALEQNYIPLHITETKSGLLMTSGDALYQIQFDPFTVKGFKGGKCRFSLVPHRAFEAKEKESILRLALDTDEGIYGLGQDPMANLNQNGFERRMWNIYGSFRRSGSASIPFYTSSKGYGLLLNNAYPSRFCIGKAVPSEKPSRAGAIWTPAPWEWGASNGENDCREMSIILDDKRMDVFLMCGDVFEVQSLYQKLTGYAPIPPKWAFGFIQCRNRYRSQAEILQIAHEYRQRKIPCDALVVDWQWYKYTGDLDWDKDAWPDVKAMSAELKQMGFHLMLAQHPFVNKDCINFKEFSENGYLNRPLDTNITNFTFDHTNPEARKAWWSKIKKLAEDGVDGYWTDMGELQEHKVGTESYLGSREKCHNLYTVFWSKCLYEGHRKDFETRCVSLHRSAFAGSHRYGALLWSGDIHATWDVLRDQVVIGPTVCASGQPYWCTDIGGFFGSDDLNAELYIRWLQWGIFCPIFRTHGTRPDNEVYRFSAECEKVSTAFIKLRYQLLPYIYSNAYQNHTSGRPLMRPLVFDYPNDKTACECKHQYMFGDSLMIAPVVDYGKRSADVYLPDGAWYDFWTDREYKGGQTVTVSAPLDRIPVFVKAGAIIPMVESADHTGEVDFSNVTLHTYPGASGAFTLYEDAGEGYAYENGEYRLTDVRMSADGDVELTVTHKGYDTSVAYTVHDHRKCKGENLSLCVLTQVTPMGSVSIDSNFERGGASRVYITAENHTDTVCKMRYVIKQNGVSAAKMLSDKEEELLPFAFTGKPCLVGTFFGNEDGMQALGRGYDVEVNLTAHGNTADVKTALKLPTDNITNWTIIGSFQHHDTIQNALEKIYPAEEDPVAPYYMDDDVKIIPVKSRRRYDCQGYVGLPAPAPKSYIDNGPRFNGVAYARTVVYSECEQDAYIELTAEPSIKLWVNGEVVFTKSEIVLRSMLPNAVHLKKGENVFMVKSAVSATRMDSGREFGFSLRLADENGETLTNVYN